MNNENLQFETKSRRFLLGEMPENERELFEQNFIADEELFENLRVAEDELIENYVRGNLTNVDKQKFEANFLITEKRRERVAFTREMLRKLNLETVSKQPETLIETTSFWQTLVGLFKQPQFAFGSALAILAIIFGGWFLLRSSEKSVDIVQNTPTPTPIVLITPTPQIVETPTVTPTPKIETNINQPNKNVNKQTIENRQIEKEIEANLNNQNSNTQTKPKDEKAKPTISTLALFVGSVRGDGKTNNLNLPKNSGGANLQLNLENQDYKIYRTEIIDQNGNVIYRSGKMSAKKSRLNTFVPANKLKRGDYIVKVYGKNPQGEDESVADYQFRVNQK
ncbi:MAG: hypothetical protein MUC29_00480 [Pyrinomonadaceae bacterium]|nr:hypothetical protein [Pyrinomonadaceae bacterium]